MAGLEARPEGWPEVGHGTEAEPVTPPRDGSWRVARTGGHEAWRMDSGKLASEGETGWHRVWQLDPG